MTLATKSEAIRPQTRSGFSAKSSGPGLSPYCWKPASMIAAVADSDVVLVNPTHVAVALRYEPGRSAPRVVAKGSALIAERIREKAAEAGVPMVRDIPLARAVFASCELGHEIPEDLYTAVARVLVFVDALRRRGAARGIHSLPGRRPA